MKCCYRGIEICKALSLDTLPVYESYYNLEELLLQEYICNMLPMQKKLVYSGHTYHLVSRYMTPSENMRPSENSYTHSHNQSMRLNPTVHGDRHSITHLSVNFNELTTCLHFHNYWRGWKFKFRTLLNSISKSKSNK